MTRVETEAFEPEHFVDRELLIEYFGKLLKPERPKSVVLIEADELMGKTWLLDWMCRLCSPFGGQVQVPVPAARIDFWERQDDLQDPLSLVRLIRDALRQSSYFSKLNEVINRFTGGRPAPLVTALQGLAEALETILDLTSIGPLCRGLGIDHDDLEGGEHGTISEKCYSLVDILEKDHRLTQLFANMRENFPDRDLGQEEQAIAAARAAGFQPAGAAGDLVEDLGNPLPVDGRRGAEAKISEAFFACIQRLVGDHKPVIILFDSVELAPDWAQLWIKDDLMEQLQAGSLTDVVVIVAGRDISKLKRTDPAGVMKSTVLEGFDKESIRKFLDSYHLPYNEKKLSDLLEYSQRGKPGMLALMTADKRLAQKHKEEL